MAKVFDFISEELQKFIITQKIFFVGTAPLSSTGHVNLSPKGLDSFRILSPHRVGYLDVTGSGNETSAHLQENGRITLMFCAFRRLVFSVFTVRDKLFYQILLTGIFSILYFLLFRELDKLLLQILNEYKLPVGLVFPSMNILDKEIL